MRFASLILVAIVSCISLAGISGAQEKPTAKKKSPFTPSVANVEYANVDGASLKLDLYLPTKSARKRAGGLPSPCVVFVHGGGWKNGSKASGAKNAAWLTEHGFAVASIDYRLTDVAKWPAQIDDCYAAVRWVRENAKQHGLDMERVGAFGTSAGGHLVALMGTRPEPDVRDGMSRVQAVCDWFGPTDLLTMPANNKGDVANSNGAKLLGATVREVPELARDASALSNISVDDAAFLIMHGEDDPGVPLEQSKRLHAALIDSGVNSTLHVVAGAGHGGKEFQTPEVRSRVLRFFQAQLMQNWSQGPGSAGSFKASGSFREARLFKDEPATAPTNWSVTRNQNIRWRKTLPATGQSTVVTWGNRIFFTTMEPVEQDSPLGSNIDAWCCDADTGETIWKKRINGDYPLRQSGCFSDSSSPPPVTDGERVCFFNASGRIACFDFDGNLVWQNEMMPVGRTQPFMVGPNVVFIKQSYMPDEHGHFTHEHKDLPVERWTQLQALNLATGAPAWNTTCGVNMGSVSLPITRKDGREVIVCGRGGGHSPPEKPEGISMVSAEDGSTLWTLPLKKFMSTMTMNLYGDHVLIFHGDEHLWVNAMTGEIDRRVSIVGKVTANIYDRDTNAWWPKKVDLKSAKKSRMLIQQSNVLAGRYHYFRSYTQPWLGRVDAVSGKVEYLSLPLQLKRTADDPKDYYAWDEKDMTAEAVELAKNSQRKPLKKLPIQFTGFTLNECRDSAGHLVMGDARSQGNGWGHHASQVPTVVGKHLYIPTMSGTVFVVRHAKEKLAANAIAGRNDLGPLGESWTRASLSFAAGRLYAHTIKEIICIEQPYE